MTELLEVLNCSERMKFPAGDGNPICEGFEFDEGDILGKIRDKTPRESKAADVWQVNQGTGLVCDRTSCKKRCSYGFV